MPAIQNQREEEEDEQDTSIQHENNLKEVLNNAHIKKFSEKEALDKLYQTKLDISFRESIHMYLKPHNAKGLHLLMVILDSFLSLLFLVGIVFHIVEDEFSTLNDKVIECIIGIGLSVIVMVYCIFDGIRFLDSTFDQVLFIFSCISQKPILFPILFPSRFKSPEATENFSEQRIVKINGQMPQIFVLAVQEINFFYSFTLSFFIALTALVGQIMDWRFESVSSRMLLAVSAIQWVYGMITCIYLYGRKVPLDDEEGIDEYDDDDEDSDEQQ